MATDADSPLSLARDAYARHAWADAFDLFRQAEREAPLGIANLERLVWSAGMQDQDVVILAR